MAATNQSGHIEAFRRGRDLERRERAEWLDGDWEQSRFEAPIAVSGRRGRIDVLLDLDDGSRVVIEIKATDWERMAERRVRPNVLRHIRQILRYVHFFREQGIDTHPALVYTRPPEFERRRLIQHLANELAVQVVWRDEDEATAKLLNDLIDSMSAG